MGDACDSSDCNGDGLEDTIQCRNGTLADVNSNDIPDCCEQGTPCVVGIYPVQWRIADGGNGHWYQWKAWGSVQSLADAVAESNALVRNYESGLAGYTYLEAENGAAM